MTWTVSDSQNAKDWATPANSEEWDLDDFDSLLTIDSEPQEEHGFIPGVMDVNFGTLRFDARAIRVLVYDNVQNAATNPPVMGDTIVGATSGATGEIIAFLDSNGVNRNASGLDNTAGSGFKFRSVSGAFEDDEEIQVSGAAGSDWKADAAMPDAQSGTVTTANGAGTTLIDSTATFLSDGARPGDKVRNATDGSFGVVTSVDSEVQLTHTVLSGGAENDWDSSDAWDLGADRVGWIMPLFAKDLAWDVTGAAAWEMYGEWTFLERFSGTEGTHKYHRSDGNASQTWSHYCTAFLPAISVETGKGTDEWELYINIDPHGGFGAVDGTEDISKVFRQNTGSRTITFGDGTNGVIPPAGARVRVPNLHVSQAQTSAIYTPWVGTSNNDWIRLNLQLGASLAIDKAILTAIWGNTWAPAGTVVLNDWYHAGHCRFLDTPVNLTLNRCAGSEITGAAPGDAVLELQNVGTFAANDGFWAGENNAHTTLQVETQNGATFIGCRAARWNMNNATDTSFYVDMGKVTFVDCEIIGPIRAFVETVIENLRGAGSPLDQGTDYGRIVAVGSGARITVDGYTPILHASEYHVATESSAERIAIKNVGSRSTAASMTLGSDQSAGFMQYAHGFMGAISLRDVHVGATGYTQGIILFDSQASETILTTVWGPYDSGLTFATLTNGLVKGFRGGDGGISNTATLGRIMLSSAGSGVGTHFMDTFDSATTGAIIVNFVAKTDNQRTSGDWVTENGTVDHDGAGFVYLRTLDDSIEHEFPYTILGHSGFQNVAPTISNGSGSANSRIKIDYQVDKLDGNGYGSGSRPAGDGVWSEATASNLNAENSGWSNPELGFKLKVRVRTDTAGDTSLNRCTGCSIPTTSTNAFQEAIEYPADTGTVELQNVVVGTEYRVFNVTKGVELAVGTAAASTVTLARQNAEDTDVIRADFRKSTPPGTRYRPDQVTGVMSNDFVNLYASQEVDPLVA